MALAPFERSIVWRGLTYDIGGRDRIRLRAYRPFAGRPGQQRPQD
jgi:hypothetical protein